MLNKLPHGRRTITDMIRDNLALIQAIDTSDDLDCGCSTCDAEGHGLDAHECVPFCSVCRTVIVYTIVAHSFEQQPTSAGLLGDLGLLFNLPPEDLNDLSDNVRMELERMGAR